MKGRTFLSILVAGLWLAISSVLGAADTRLVAGELNVSKSKYTTGPLPKSAAAKYQASDDGLRKALTFHASFDRGTDAAFALGDRQLYTASSYKNLGDSKPGIGNPDVSVASGEGRFGDALKFKKKNTKAIHYKAEKNVAYQPRNWNGTVSFWLSLDPNQDLEPGYCDPLQVTDEDYNDAALWADFTKDDKPRHFRLGVFGDLKTWNPKGLEPDKNPDFMRRLVVVKEPPFGRGKWTHVAITFSGLGSGSGGTAKLYLNGCLQGTTPEIREPFTWDVPRAAIRLGVNYVGLFDELSAFNRPLNDKEIQTLYELKGGVGALHR
jgi:concanavalin A-like lectin/glucanase superfamily protein